MLPNSQGLLEVHRKIHLHQIPHNSDVGDHHIIREEFLVNSTHALPVNTLVSQVEVEPFPGPLEISDYISISPLYTNISFL